MNSTPARTLLLLSVAAIAAVVLANVRIPPNANTGRPGEVTCANCHVGQSAPPDSSALAGLPGAGYEPGSVYNLTLSVRFAGMKRWGFEVTAADSANRPAGRFVITDTVNTQFGTSRGFGYVKQTAAGTWRGRADSCSWSFAWAAPDSDAGPVTFFWDALPCNNDGGAYGDVEILGRRTLAAAGPRVEPRRHLWHYPHPESTRAIIIYRGNPGIPFRIFAADGRLVGQCRGAMTEVDAIADWHGLDDRGMAVPAGDYFIEYGESVDSVIDVQFVPRAKGD